MTSFFRRSATLLAMGGAILGTWVTAGTNALALTQEQVVEQLQDIPVFTITDESGIPFVATIPNEEDDANPTIVTEVFISHDDATSSLELLKEQNPALGEDAQVTPVSLGRIYEVAIQGKDAEQNLEFLFVPIVEEVAFAMSILPNATEGSGGVPLFMVSATEDPEEGPSETDLVDPDENIALLTLQNGEDEIIPLFFKREQFDTIVTSIGEEQPDFVENLRLHVIWLEDFIGILERNDDTDIQQYQMVPLPESVDFAQNFVRDLTGNTTSNEVVAE